MKDKTYNLIFYLIVALTCFLLLYWFNSLQDNVLRILLYPHAKSAEIFYNIPLVYVNGVGYSAVDGSFAIGRECMGIKFIVIIFGMTACMFANCFIGMKKILWFFTSLLGSILIGIVISCIRIVGSVPFIQHPKFPLFHSGIGISLYFFTLTTSYVLLNKFLRSDIHEENP